MQCWRQWLAKELMLQSCCSTDSQGCTAELHVQHGNTAQGQDRTSGLLQTLHYCHIVPLYLTIGVATCVCLQLPSTDVHALKNHTLIWLCLKLFYLPDFKAFKMLLKQCMQSRLQLLSLIFPYLKSKRRELRCLVQEQEATLHKSTAKLQSEWVGMPVLKMSTNSPKASCINGKGIP